MKTYILFLALSIALICFSCEKSLIEETLPIGCSTTFSENSYSVSVQEEYVSLPGVVSVFFKVDNSEGSPVAGLSSSNFSVYEKGRNDDCFKNISAFESNARISPNAQIFRYNTMLVLDLSGSVLNSSLDELKNAAQKFVENIMPPYPNQTFQMGIWWFDGEDKLHELQNFTSDRIKLTTQIANLNIDMSKDPSTDLYGAVVKSSGVMNAKINSIESDIISASSVIIFTDGTDQAARYSKGEALAAIQSSGPLLNFYTIGLGSEIDEDVLKSIGKSGSIIAENNSELEDKFNETADLVFTEANSYYLFEYCSPKRDGSGLNELILRVEHDGEKGYAMTKFDATGFTAGCD